MEYCGPRALPHSQFLLWNTSDQDKALAWLQHDRGRCSGCGTFSSDWETESGQPKIPPPYEVHSRICIGCAEIGRYRRFLEKNKEDSPGTMVELREADPTEYNPDLFTE